MVRKKSVKRKSKRRGGKKRRSKSRSKSRSRSRSRGGVSKKKSSKSAKKTPKKPSKAKSNGVKPAKSSGKVQCDKHHGNSNACRNDRDKDGKCNCWYDYETELCEPWNIGKKKNNK